MIHVIVTVELVPGKREEFLDAFRRVVPQVLDEEGCLEYGPAIDVETSIGAQIASRPDVATIIEKWQSLEHLEAHLVAPHMLEYRPQVKHLIKDSTLQILQPV
ncbi:MAG: antibiotic biosynthesis monooxygenase [Planctomycetaceae bacterium]|nr:antibiotic biosynthesis monooxygenase [Planctomycetaceae bacterium]